MLEVDAGFPTAGAQRAPYFSVSQTTPRTNIEREAVEKETEKRSVFSVPFIFSFVLCRGCPTAAKNDKSEQKKA